MEHPFVSSVVPVKTQVLPRVNSISQCQTGIIQQNATEKNAKLKLRDGLEALSTGRVKWEL